MKSNALTLELFRNASFPPEGLQVAIDGILYIGPEGYFVVFSDEKIRIPIAENAIDKRLLRTVPCFLGGPCLYNDSVCIVATLKKNDGRVEIMTIESGVLTRDEESYVF